MPPPDWVSAVLPEIVELVTTRMPLFWMPPAWVAAVLPEMVELVTVRLPLLFWIPPPAWVIEVLPEIVVLMTVRVPQLVIPPPSFAELPVIVELETVKVPAFSMAPPAAVVFAPDKVTPEIARLPPEAMFKIWKLRPLTPLLPLMIREEALGPVMVSEPAPEVAAIVGSAADKSVIVLAPLVNNEEAKIISSLAEVALASVIACRNEPAPASAVVVTVI